MEKTKVTTRGRLEKDMPRLVLIDPATLRLVDTSGQVESG